MMKKKNKLLHILILAAAIAIQPLFGSVCSAAEKTSTTGVNAVTAQDAWKFMKDNSSEFNKFAKVFGEQENKLLSNIIECGKELCNLDTSVCLVKEQEGILNDYIFRGLLSFALQEKETTKYKYTCVDMQDTQRIGELEKKGWAEIDLSTHKNLRKKVEKSSRITDNQKIKEKEYKIKEKECYAAKNASGNIAKYCVKATGNEVRVIAGDAKGRGCDVIPVMLYNNSKCRFCSLMGVIYAAADEITVLSATKFASSFATVIAVGLVIWLALKTLVFVSSLTKQDAAKYITEILQQSYKFLIAYFLLVYYGDIFSFIILPILNAGLNFGTNMLTGGEIQSVLDRFGVDDLTLNAFEAVDKTMPSDYFRNLENVHYKLGTYALLENLAYNVNLKYATLQSIGSSLWCLGGRYIIGRPDFEFGLGIECRIYAIFFWAFGFLMTLAFVFYLLDAVVQLGIVGALLPFLVASWPFKITSKYTATGFKMFLNSVFNFMMIGMIVTIAISLIDSSLSLKESAGISGLIEALDNVDTAKLKQLVNVLSVEFLMFMFACILGFMLMSKVSDLTNRFASGGIKPVAPSFATMGASAVKGAAAKVTAPTREAIGEYMEDKTKKVAGKAVDKGIGLVTMRPVRRFIKNRLGGKSSDSKQEEQNKGSGVQTIKTANVGNSRPVSTNSETESRPVSNNAGTDGRKTANVGNNPTTQTNSENRQGSATTQNQNTANVTGGKQTPPNANEGSRPTSRDPNTRTANVDNTSRQGHRPERNKLDKLE